MNTYFYLEPNLQKIENIYFMESSINLEDNIWDFLKVDETEITLFEVQQQQQV